MEENKIQFLEVPTYGDFTRREIHIVEDDRRIGMIQSYLEKDGSMNYIGLEKIFNEFTIHHDLAELKKRICQKLANCRKAELDRYKLLQQDANRYQNLTKTKTRKL